MKKKMNRILSTVLFAMIVFSGCSYKEFEDGIKTKVSGGGNSEDGSAILMTEETPDMQENKIYGMGEEIPAEDGISYIVESTRFIHNINDAGLKQEDMNVLYSTTLDEDGNIVSGDGFDESQKAWYKADSGQQEYGLLLVDITVQKVSEADTDSQMDADMDGIPNVWPSIRIGTGQGIQYQHGINSCEAVYLDAQSSGKNYYTFNLPVGEKKQIQMGWILPQNTLDMEWYYIINAGYDKEKYKFCKLDIEG